MTSAGGVFLIGSVTTANFSQVVGTLDLSAGTITVGSSAFRKLSMDGGLLQNGTVVNSGGTATIHGTLSNITWLGDLDLSMSSGTFVPQLRDVRVLGMDGSSPGVINIQGSGPFSSAVNILGTQTLANLTVNIGGGGAGSKRDVDPIRSFSGVYGGIATRYWEAGDQPGPGKGATGVVAQHGCGAWSFAS